MSELPTQRDFDEFGAWPGRDVLGPDGDRLGAVEVIFLDEATGVPEWVLVTLDDGDPAFVPLAGATVDERSIRVEQDRERIAAAPSLEPSDTLSVADERRLYEHYGLAYSQSESSTVLPEGATSEGDTAEQRPRLRKYVGAPVPGPAAEEPAAEPEPAPAPAPAASSGRFTPSATTIPGPAPHVIPPEGGFQAHEEAEQPRRNLAIPAGLAAAIGVLIGLLAYRRRRR